MRLISLQKGSNDQAPFAVERYDFDDGPDAFVDTAAMMMNCELVISADSSPAHVAGALGVPCWVALKQACDWRWFTGRDDTPWYPSLRLFRQAAPGDWAGVFARITAALTGYKR